MGRLATAEHLEKLPDSRDPEPQRLEGDPRWQLAQRVIASRHFSRAPLLSKFLLHIVAETVAGRAGEITEHQIGVQVFDRPSSYRTVEDNIVRNYARQLRRRLCEYFAEEGAGEPQHIGIPLGGYIPVFAPAVELTPTEEPLPVAGAVTSLPVAVVEEAPATDGPAGRPRAWHRTPAGAVLLLLLYSALVTAIAWLMAVRVHGTHPAAAAADPTVPLWNAIFGGQVTTYVVPADAGLNLLEDLSRQPLPLAQYINGGYANVPLGAMDDHSARDLRGQHFTSFVDMQIIAALNRLPEFDPHRAILRFPRDMRLDDLRNANAVILGSVGSNPWAAVADNNANFRIVYRDGMEGATITNAHPQAGESPTYVSHWNQPAHETFALISCLPNLAGNGRLLVLQGLDVAGTQAAGEALFHPTAIAPILRRATRADGSLRYFEILLRSTSIESSATGTQVVGSRIY